MQMNGDEIVKALRCEATCNAGECPSEECTPQCKYYADETYTMDTLIPSAADLITSLRAQLADSRRREHAVKEQLKRKCLDECAAVKCICDIETYLMLGSAKYIKRTIEDWRTQQDAEREERE